MNFAAFATASIVIILLWLLAYFGLNVFIFKWYLRMILCKRLQFKLSAMIVFMCIVITKVLADGRPVVYIYLLS